MAIRGLILDFAGVMTTAMSLNSTAFERSENLTPGSYPYALDEDPVGVAIYAKLETGSATQSEWNNVIGKLLGIDPTDLMRRALANLHPEPLMVEAVAAARATGIKTALLSNSFGLTPFNIYEEFGLLDLFDVVVLSETEGVRKPDPVIYQRTLDRLSLPAQECIFIDDHESNLPAAAKLGITTLHHTDAGVTVRRLADLLPVSID